MTKNKAIFSDVALVIVSLLWGLGYPMTNWATQGFDPFYETGIRFGLPGIILGVLFIKKVIHMDFATFRSGVLVGVIIVIGNVLQFASMKQVSAGKESFLIATYILMTPFVARLISKEALEWKSILFCLLAVLGIAILCFDGSTMHLGLGEIEGLLGALCFAIEITLIGKCVKEVEPMGFVIIQMFSSGVMSLVIAVFVEEAPDFHSMSMKPLIGMAYLVILNGVVTRLLQNYAQKYATSSHASVVLATECLIAAVSSALLTGEVFTVRMIIGCAIIFAATMLAVWDQIPTEQRRDNL